MPYVFQIHDFITIHSSETLVGVASILSRWIFCKTIYLSLLVTWHQEIYVKVFIVYIQNDIELD